MSFHATAAHDRQRIKAMMTGFTDVYHFSDSPDEPYPGAKKYTSADMGVVKAIISQQKNAIVQRSFGFNLAMPRVLIILDGLTKKFDEYGLLDGAHELSIKIVYLINSVADVGLLHESLIADTEEILGAGSIKLNPDTPISYMPLVEFLQQYRGTLSHVSAQHVYTAVYEYGQFLGIANIDALAQLIRDALDKRTATLATDALIDHDHAGEFVNYVISLPLDDYRRRDQLLGR